MFVEGGKIKLIMGPMFSGKSTTMVHMVQKYKYKNKKTVLIKYSGDNRYENGSTIVTHELSKFQAIPSTKLSDIYESDLVNYDVIGIDEGQFFEDLVPICEKLCNNGKIVIVAALSGNFKMEPFANVALLISKADKIKLLKAYCHYCKKSAGFSLRTIKCDKEILIGAADMYRPVCKSCYYSYVLSSSCTQPSTPEKQVDKTEKVNEIETTEKNTLIL